MGLFTRYKNNFKKQAWWMWGNQNVFIVILTLNIWSLILLPTNFSSPCVRTSHHSPGEGQTWILSSGLVVCAPQLMPSWGPTVSSVRGCVPLCGGHQKERVTFLLENLHNNGQCQQASLVSSSYCGCFIQLPV